MDVSNIQLNMMAKLAESEFLTKEIPLNQSIIKIASENKLNQYQIARICEAANVGVYNSLFAKTGNGKFSYDVADQESIINALNKKAESELVDDYSMRSDDLAKLMKLDEGGSMEKEGLEEKTASVTKPTPSIKQLTKMIKKAERCSIECDNMIFEKTMWQKEAEIEVKKLLKTAHLLKENILDVLGAAIACHPTKVAYIKNIFKDLVTDLNIKSLTKEAQTFTENSAGQIISNKAINKNHPILKHLNTAIQEKNSVDKYRQDKLYVTDKLQLLRNALSVKMNEDNIEEKK